MFDRNTAPVWAKYGYDQVMGAIKSQDAPTGPDALADYHNGRAAAERQLSWSGDSNIASFRKARAEREGDNTLWTPEDAVADFLDRIKSGQDKPVRLLILYEEELPNGNFDLGRVRAGISRADETHLLSMALFIHQQNALSST